MRQQRSTRHVQSRAKDKVDKNEKVSAKTKEDVRKKQTNAIKPYMWKPGQSGNPGGRHKKVFPQYLRDIGFLPCSYEIKKSFLKYFPQLTDMPLNHFQLLVLSTYVDAIKYGSDRARDFIVDRIDGKVPMTVEQSNLDSRGDILKHLDEIADGTFTEVPDKAESEDT